MLLTHHPHYTISTYPHGGTSSAAIFFTSVAAMLATGFGLASCRMFVLTFVSDQGNFEEYFDIYGRSNTSNVRTQYKSGIGLFQWLSPTSSVIFYGGNATKSSLFDEIVYGQPGGICVGYQQSMLKYFSDETYFNVSRSFAAFAVILGIVSCLTCIMSACIQWNQLQLTLFRLCLLLSSICTGMTLFFKQSSLCQSMFLERQCDLDEGGFLLIGGVILWLSAFLIATLFFRKEQSADGSNIDPYHAKRFRAAQKRAAKAGARAARAARDQSASQAYPSQPTYDQPSARAVPTASLANSRQTRRINANTSRDSSDTMSITDLPMTPADSNDSSMNVLASLAEPGSRSKSKRSVTVDDVGENGDLEVYISDRLNKIEKIADV
jgi:hypothetical protein